jgi:D-sedoheptulose 7-phosphate isomerase
MKDLKKLFKEYQDNLNKALDSVDDQNLEALIDDFKDSKKNNSQIFLIGNGGSGGNAIHIANDFIYGARDASGVGYRIHALSANPSVITCLGNDLGYDKIFSFQLQTLAKSGDILLALSGSGNSPNIIESINVANDLGLKTHAILGFDGGLAGKLASNVIHTKIFDMQIAEDCQLILLHMIMRHLC